MVNKPQDKIRKQKIAENLEPVFEDVKDLSHKILEPYEVRHNIVDYEEMNELIAYGGFQERFPHYRWGQNFVQQKAKDQLAGGALEIVNNDDPSNSFLQESNSMTAQKGVITHVEAHADFFKNNPEFEYREGDELNSAQMLAENKKAIQNYIDDPEIDPVDVEKLIDAYISLEYQINPQGLYKRHEDAEDIEYEEKSSEEVAAEIASNPDIQKHLADNLEDIEHEEEFKDEEKDLLKYIIENGEYYDYEEGKAKEMESWKIDVLERLREESYYFGAQANTKVMNEGWATYWQSFMMQDEGMAGEDGFLEHSDLMSRVLGGPIQSNPYTLGVKLWEYVENQANRKEVASKLLEVEGIDSNNFHDDLDFEYILGELEPDDLVDQTADYNLEELLEMDDERLDHESIEEMIEKDEEITEKSWKPLSFEGLAERHYSLVKPENRNFLEKVSRDDLESWERYRTDQYSDIDDALDEVDRTKGWNQMFQARSEKNDIGFIDEYVTQEFVDENQMWLGLDLGDKIMSVSHNAQPIKDKLLIDRTNFGKPIVVATDDNYENEGGLLLEHRFNGLDVDLGQMTEVMKRTQENWGKPVGFRFIKNQRDEDYWKDVQESVQEEMAKRNSDLGNAFPDPETQGYEFLYDPDEEFKKSEKLIEELGFDPGDNFRVERLKDDESEELHADMEFDPLYSSLKLG